MSEIKVEEPVFHSRSEIECKVCGAASRPTCPDCEKRLAYTSNDTYRYYECPECKTKWNAYKS